MCTEVTRIDEEYSTYEPQLSFAVLHKLSANHTRPTQAQCIPSLATSPTRLVRCSQLLYIWVQIQLAVVWLVVDSSQKFMHCVSTGLSHLEQFHIPRWQSTKYIFTSSIQKCIPLFHYILLFCVLPSKKLLTAVRINHSILW